MIAIYNKRNEYYGGIIYLLAIFLETVVMMTDHCASWTIPYRGRITHIAFILFCIKILLSHYSKKQYVVIGILGILGAVSYITCGDEYIIRAIVMLAASVGTDFNKTIKLIIYLSIIGTIVIVSLSLLGVCGDIAELRDFGRGGEELRYRLGFNHANNIHDMLWYIITAYILLKDSRLGWIESIIMTGFNIGLFLLTGSRTGALVVQLIIIGLLLVRYVPLLKDSILIHLCSLFSLLATVIISIYCSIHNVREREAVVVLDKIFNGRMEMLTEHANFKEWVMFPTSRIAEHVDNGFVSFTYEYGTIWGIILILFIVYMIWSLYIQKDSCVEVLLMGTVLVTFMESTFIFNVSLLCNMLLIIFISQVSKVKSVEE